MKRKAVNLIQKTIRNLESTLLSRHTISIIACHALKSKRTQVVFFPFLQKKCIGKEHPNFAFGAGTSLNSYYLIHHRGSPLCLDTCIFGDQQYVAQ